MREWVCQEAQAKRHELWDTASWPTLFLHPSVDIPKQHDGHSCGLYAIALADCLGAGVPLQQCTMQDSHACNVRAHVLQLVESVCAVQQRVQE